MLPLRAHLPYACVTQLQSKSTDSALLSNFTSHYFVSYFCQLTNRYDDLTLHYYYST